MYQPCNCVCVMGGGGSRVMKNEFEGVTLSKREYQL